jgi:hypothetical protein
VEGLLNLKTLVNKNLRSPQRRAGSLKIQVEKNPQIRFNGFLKESKIGFKE